MNYVLEMGLDIVIHLPSFITIGLAIQKLIEGDTCTDTQTHIESKVIS
jgi:hypothetical protein